MPMTFVAVYENGVLKPTTPLPFGEGERVEVTAAPERLQPLKPPPLTPEQEAALRRIREAKTPEELWAASDAAAPLFPNDPDYDVVEDMDKYRRATGQRPLIPRPGDEDYEAAS